MVHILELPDEVKLKIFGYLDGVAKIEMMNVCKDLNRVGRDREVITCVNFAKNYKLNLVHLKYLSHKTTCGIVTVLNLNHIYWISSALLRNVLIKFTNLTTLYVVATQLSFRDLATVLMHTNKVKKLALTQKSDDLSSEELVLKTKIALTHLFITHNSYSIRATMACVSMFAVLDELWLVQTCSQKPQAHNDSRWWYYGTKLPKVAKKIVLGRQTSCIQNRVKLINMMKSADGEWIKTFDNDAETMFVVYEKTLMPTEASDPVDCGWSWLHIGGFRTIPWFNKHVNCKPEFDRCIESMQNDLDMWNLFAVNEQRIVFLNNLEYSKMNYTSLNLIRSPNCSPLDDPELNKAADLFEVFFFLPNLKPLRKLRTDSFPFWEKMKPKNTEQRDTHMFKRRRIGIEFAPPKNNTLFERFTVSSPEMRDFEMVDLNEFPMRVDIWQTDSLKFIQNWTQLKRLVLSSVNFRNGKFLIDVTKNCKQLEILKIRDDTMLDISSDLCEALQHAANLKDLRLERKGAIPIDHLFESIIHCKQIERVYLKCRFASKISKNPLGTLFTQCKNIVFLFIFISELPDAVCKSIKQNLKEIGLKPNQIVRIRGDARCLYEVYNDDIPDIHVLDMVCQSTDLYFDYLKEF